MRLEKAAILLLLCGLCFIGIGLLTLVLSAGKLVPAAFDSFGMYALAASPAPTLCSLGILIWMVAAEPK